MTRPRRKATAADGFDWKRLRNMDARMIHAGQHGGSAALSAGQLLLFRPRLAALEESLRGAVGFCARSGASGRLPEVLTSEGASPSVLKCAIHRSDPVNRSSLTSRRRR